ncbi:hypothetical protein, partial [Chitinivibrio alkaliphilus]|uniref:hypothetical protein n=1 Tax=Chitinivibrio alkaliphilus TaxID=1505232 RepID=UPI000556FADB
MQYTLHKKSIFFLMLCITPLLAHLPSQHSALLQHGRRASTENLRSGFQNHGAWDPNEEYRGDHTIQQGDTVSHGKFEGQKLWWWAKFYASGEQMEPGMFAPEGGTSPWVLINSASAIEDGRVSYEWSGWNDDIEQDISPMDAVIPTWRDGAEGAYAFTHDDIGAMPLDLSVKPAIELAKDFPEIKQAWGVFVGEMNQREWDYALEMAMQGHELFNHSMEHTSAAEQWQWFYPGQTIPAHDPSIPEEIRGLTVVGTWGDPEREPVYPVETPAIAVFESPLVAIEATHYWTQNAPSSEIPGTELEDPFGTVIEPRIYAKDGVEEIVLPTGQKQYVKYTYRDESGSGNNEGYIAATGPSWMELSQLDDYGGEGYWEPDSPALLSEPETWDGSKQWHGAGEGTIYEYNGTYWQSLSDAPGSDPEEGHENWRHLGDIEIPFFSSEGTYTGRTWSSSTQHVGEDQGAPAFIAKIFCVAPWEDEEYALNIRDAKDSIDAQVWERIENSGEYFRRGRRDAHYGYPFDAYSEVTHDSLYQAGYTTARGGAKSGVPTPGDFFHPFRIDFDAFFITRNDWTVNSAGEEFIYPNNPHVLMGANEMVDSIISQRGYMIRELHAVADIPDGEWYNDDRPEFWPLNTVGAGQGGWWGGITVNQLRRHYEYVQERIDDRRLTVFTPTEAVTYRITANATESATVSRNGDNYTLSTELNRPDLDERYWDEISVIVHLEEAVDSLAVQYHTINEEWCPSGSPRRRPRQMD